jgi:excisionase family DNA binding protein
MTDQPLVDAEQLAKALSCSKRTVERLVDGGRIPFYRVRGTHRFDIAEVKAALRSEKVPA